MKSILSLFLVASLLIGAAWTCLAEGNTERLNDIRAQLVTTKGTISLVLFPSRAPVTVANFVNLAQRGYYNDVTFHRVIPNFMVQTGDRTGTGRGTPGYTFPDEFSPSLKHSGPGVLSMANAGPSTNGSQFFITHRATPHLDGHHTIFGHVTAGQDVVDRIERGDRIKKIQFLDSTEAILKEEAKLVQEWNQILDRNNRIR